MRTIATGHIAVLCLLLGGCATQYRTVSQTQVTTVSTKKGEEIKIEKAPYIAFEEVIERSPNVKSVTRMTDLKGEREPSFFALAPSGDEMVYQALEEADGQALMNLWKAPTSGGTGMTRLTAGRYYDLEPTYAPSGTDVLFASNRSSETPRLFRVRADGAGGITKLTQSEAADRSPSCTSDGDMIYYQSKPFNSQTWQIWRINANGALPTQLKEGVRPRTSPNMKQVLYCAQDRKSEKWKIWVMNIDGTGETQLTTGTDSDDTYPSWSLDGKMIVYASDIGKDSNGKRNFDIWTMSADGSMKTQLTTNGSTDFLPSYSADGRYIYFLSNRGFNWDIWRMEMVE
ncbi:TolB family protein [Candidatus Eisenbacteria bacterium]|uniref:TolB family protein n=1 Tax=Eiseniibacteriota bacterium TaxID=2212470 RepID=A0ABV6YLX0_UNCEI